MLEKQSTGNDDSIRNDAILPRAEGGSPVEHATKSKQEDPASKAVTPANHRPGWKRRLVIAALGVLVLAAALIFGVLDPIDAQHRLD